MGIPTIERLLLKGMEMAQFSIISMRMPFARTFGCAILINITYIN